MAKHEITCTFSNEGSRNEVRMRVVNRFAEEEAGTGSGDKASRYIYYVEQLESGDRVYLQRPANLHNGFDFLVCVENINYAPEGERARNYPKHEDIGNDLKAKKSKDPEMYSKLYNIIKQIYECHDVEDTELKDITFGVGLPADHVIKVLKWLFIEQDVRYWNYSGRGMTWSIIPDK